MARDVDRNLRAIVIGATILSALAAAVWVGSWQHARGGANERPEARGTVAGFTTYAVPSAGFTIALPDSWQTFTAEEVFRDSGALDELVRENPDLAPYTDMLTDPRSPVKLIAADPNVRSNFATTANVIVNNAPGGYSFEDFVRDSETQIKTLTAMAADVKSEVVELPAGKAQRLSYDAPLTLRGQERTITTLQYGLVANGHAYILTYTTLPELGADYRNDFERSVNSFSVGG